MFNLWIHWNSFSFHLGMIFLIFAFATEQTVVLSPSRRNCALNCTKLEFDMCFPSVVETPHHQRNEAEYGHVTHVYRSIFHSGYDPGIHLGFSVASYKFETIKMAC